MSVSLFGWTESGPGKLLQSLVCKMVTLKEGRMQVKDCVLPVAMGKKQLPNTNFSPEQLQQCKMKLAEKIKSKMQEKMQQ